MRLIMIAAAATIALAAPVLAQTQSQPTDTVGSGTAEALHSRTPHQVGKPVAPNNIRSTHSSNATAMSQPGEAPRNGTEKPVGTTGAPPYGGSIPKAGIAGGGPN